MLNSEQCMEKGKDTVISDPDYHTFILADRAIIDTADSLLAIKKLVFEEKKLTMGELLDASWMPTSPEREGSRYDRCVWPCAKYGNDIDEADLMVRDVGGSNGGGDPILRQQPGPALPSRPRRLVLALFRRPGRWGAAQWPQGERTAERWVHVAHAGNG